MRKIIFSILFLVVGFSCFAEQKCNKIPEEYEKVEISDEDTGEVSSNGL